MKKLIERLLLFFVGLPLILASVIFLPWQHYLVLQIELLVFTVVAILEMRTILSHRLTVHSVPLAIALGLMIPLAAFSYAVLGMPFRLITFSIAIAFVTVFALELFMTASGQFEKSLERIASSIAIVIYPGYLIMYLSIMTRWEHAGAILSAFLLMVFGCDSIAWLIGMLFGKNNRGLIAASPNKSVAGFIGGYLGSLLAAGISFFLFPDPFATSIPKLVILAFFTATAAIIGDIVESVMKRSAGLKDSGSFVPGRGGVLDSMDSILLAAPVYYILCDFLLGFAS